MADQAMIEKKLIRGWAYDLGISASSAKVLILAGIKSIEHLQQLRNEEFLMKDISMRTKNIVLRKMKERGLEFLDEREKDLRETLEFFQKSFKVVLGNPEIGGISFNVKIKGKKYEIRIRVQE